MDYSEEEIEELEAQVPLKAGALFREAYERALNAGLSVLAVDGGTLYRVNPDRSRVAIREVPKGIRIPKGTRINLK